MMMIVMMIMMMMIKIAAMFIHMMMLWYTDSFTCPPDVLEPSVVVNQTLSTVTTILSPALSVAIISTTPTNPSQYSTTTDTISSLSLLCLEIVSTIPTNPIQHSTTTTLFSSSSSLSHAIVSTTPTQHSTTITSISNSGSSLSTAAVAGTAAAVAVSALLFIFIICTLVLAIILVKAQQRKITTLGETPSTSINGQGNALSVIVQGNESCMITSHVEDEHYITIVNTESNLACEAIDMSCNAAYGEVEKRGNANMPIYESIEGSCSRRFNNESAGRELMNTGNEVSILLNGKVILSECGNKWCNVSIQQTWEVFFFGANLIRFI